MKNLSFLLLLFTIPILTNAQNFTLSGNIKDAENGEDLMGATILVKNIPNTGAFSNEYGFYSLTLPAGDHTIMIRYIGYEQVEKNISLTENQNLSFELKLDNHTLDTIQITARRDNENVTSSEMGVLRLDPREVRNVPVLFGERDIVKTLQLLPGVKSAGEGNSGFYVRGGGTDQNLILLDEAPVYNASHLLGFFSVFNSDALKDVTLYKGGMPAEYGGRASSVLDIRMKDGNKKRLGLTGGIGLISSRLTIEAPIVKDKGSFMVSGRRTYADVFLKLSKDSIINSSTLYFYDFNAKANYTINDKNRIFLSGYFGRDVFGFSDFFGLNWGNATATVRWNHLFSDKLFSNTSFFVSDYDYKFFIGDNENGFGLSSRIQDFNFKEDITWFPNSRHTVKLGGQLIHHTFIPGKLEVGSEVTFRPPNPPRRFGLEGAVYLRDDFRINNRFTVNYGLRLSTFHNMGGVSYTFDNEGNVLTETNHDRWDFFENNFGLEPRASGRYLVNESNSIKASYTRNFQYIHLLSNSVSTSPTDVYVPTTNVVKPQIADQVAVGYFTNLKDDMFEVSFEAYYKWLQNQIDYKNGADLILNSTVESELVFGKGRSFGGELLIKKMKGKMTGWISYTLSRALRTFEGINNGNEYPARQDRIHDLSLTLIYQIAKRLTVSGNFVYYTGDAVTFPSGRYDLDGFTIPFYTERNGYRFPDYHRLDLGIIYDLKERKKWRHSLSLSCYNVYGRENAFSITFEENTDFPGQTQAVRTALFKTIPSISYDFEF